MENNELVHYGVKGMKWGVRRFQRKDGSLTPAGKKRYNDSDNGDNQNRSQNGNQSGGQNRSSSSSGNTSGRRSTSEMSDAELQRVVNRLNLEKRYKELTPATTSMGQRFIKKVMNDVVVPSVTTASRNVLTSFVESSLKNQLNKQTTKKK